MRRRGLLAPLLVCVSLAAAPASANAITESVTAGSITAQMSYDQRGGFFYENVRVAIIRNGVTVVDQPAPPYPGCFQCGSGGPALRGRAPSIAILQLDATPEPEVVFDFHTGGAHCCFHSAIFDFRGGAYVGLGHPWADPFYEFRDFEGDGRPEFESGDWRFAYAFGPFAAVRFPPQIWHFSNGVMTDVTRQYPGVIRADLRRLLRQLRKKRELGIKSLLAAVVADFCLLDACGSGFKVVNTAARKGLVEKPGRYRRKLRRFLRRMGYL